jgi:nitrite reductase/ring-hydroxylating ferredoxin subunit
MDGQSSPGARQAAAPRKRFLAKSVPYEGENGLFSQSWFPICLSTDVPKGQVVGRPFLDGKVIIFRGEDGVARVMSAYCPHLGSDLSIGKVVGNNIQCAFHMFEMNSDGYCVKTGIGDDPPKNACIYVFPTRERWGVIFAFNGDEAPWELPDFIYPDEELLISVSPPIEFNADPWVFSCNTPDVAHLKLIHGMKTDDPVPDADVNWFKHGFMYHYNALHWGDKPISWDLGIHGTSIFIQDGTLDGQWFGITVPFGMPTPGKSVAYFINVVHKGSGSESDLAKAKEWLRVTTNLEVTFGSQDLDILNTIHLRPGALTKSDKFLGKFLTFLREYPRAHPSADFIR